jgi:hypothetical protein
MDGPIGGGALFPIGPPDKLKPLHSPHQFPTIRCARSVDRPRSPLRTRLPRPPSHEVRGSSAGTWAWLLGGHGAGNTAWETVSPRHHIRLLGPSIRVTPGSVAVPLVG